ncbi:MAG: hypothetical protein VXV96_03850 [Bdellovibrionota bacterium]|nr:hypothetical protein [Bdellovibrionota bacterium]
MFYLVTFYRTLFSKPMVAALWGCGLFLITFSFVGRGTLESKLVLSTKPTQVNPYFFAVMPKGINAEYVKRKLLDIPGVDKVNLMAEASIESHVKSVLESTQLDWDSDILDLNYSGLKVSLSQDLKPRSQKLIRNYLTRIAGEKDVTLGAIKTPRQEESKLNLTHLFDRVFYWLPFAGIGLFLLSLFSIREELGKESFIIETYQRRNRVFERGMAYAQAPVLLLMGALAFSYGTVALIGLGITGLGLFVILGLGIKSKKWT